ncbi:MAG TPA: hypothetical protein VIV35_01935 [Chitinophagaceae bacterium]
MKKYYGITFLAIFFSFSLFAQPQPQQPVQLPKQEIGKPQAVIKTFPVLPQYIYTDTWNGTVSWATSEAGHSSTIPDLRFAITGEVFWQSPFQEITSATPGTFRMEENNISFSFNYPPYKYFFKGAYNKYTGKITGSFTQDRMKYLNAPANYTPGSISGTFIISKK